MDAKASTDLIKDNSPDFSKSECLGCPLSFIVGYSAFSF